MFYRRYNRRSSIRKRWIRGTSKYKNKKINPQKYIFTAKRSNAHPTGNSTDGTFFKDFGLSSFLLRNLKRHNMVKTTPIQEKVMNHVRDGKNVVGISPTGSGKTGAFMIPLVDKLYRNIGRKKALVISPTRELAQQILKEGISMVYGTKLQLSLVIGGNSVYRQISRIKRGYDIVIGTPGRLLDLYKRGILAFNKFEHIVIDEVDRMLDMGFIDDIKSIYEQTSLNRQALFFSATMHTKIQEIIASMVKDYELIRLSENRPIDKVDQSVIYFKSTDEKINKLYDILKEGNVKKVLIFVNTKLYADTVAQKLRALGLRTDAIHGGKTQAKRTRTLDMYRRSRINILVATNVAARGIDITDITHVINLDEPNTYDEYIHRVGRTGRNGRYGTAYTFVQKS